MNPWPCVQNKTKPGPPRQSAARHLCNLAGSRRGMLIPFKTIGSARVIHAVQSLTLLVVFILTAIVLQAIGFLISRLVNYQYPTLGLMSFLVLFISAFFLAWPIAVRIA